MKDTSLHEIISRSGPLPPRRVAAIGLRVLAEMAAARDGTTGLRDVRPDMIMMGEDGRISVAAGRAAPGPVPGFVPPEGMAGPASDLWTLGATLFTAVEGHPPAPGSVPVQAGPLAPILGRLLAPDPSARPDAASLRTQLQDIAHPMHAEPYRPSSTPDHAAEVTAPHPARGSAPPWRGPASSPFSPNFPAPAPDTPAGGVPAHAAKPAPGAAALQSEATPPSAPAQPPAPPYVTPPPHGAPQGQHAAPQAQQAAPQAQHMGPQGQHTPPQGQHMAAPQPPYGSPRPHAAGPVPARPEGWDTTPVGAPPAGEGRPRGVFVPRSVIVFAGVLGVAMAVAIGVLAAPLFRDPSPAAAGATASPTPTPSGAGAKGRFATTPRACSLLSDELAAELVPSLRSSEVSTGECNWLTQDYRLANAQKYDLRLRITAYKQDGTEITKAKEHLSGKKADFAAKLRYATPTPAPPRDLSGIGEESFSFLDYSSINIYGGSAKIIMVTRVSNLVFEIEYERGGAKDDADGRLLAGAQKAAREVVEALKTYG
ncbi:hypothetical protein HNP84_004648 [Thermocatellispora tengchongensis]|uniref:Protein kinase domain-containing protein n=1 Tax=Thermocatellispora tengchongensis TaxID=1073253 RepID=A0A840P0Z4_9ACTN|nr:hypothetical protein [Thermocatellispora tengchongensis]MBB5134914.1 hypothetical protein [Thermocatellispora tengchongensis]